MIFPIQIRNCKNLPKEVWHPSVVYCREGWSGHVWWMSETPYTPGFIPPYTDRWELPCIHYSDDGIRWHPIEVNPIDDLNEGDIKARNYLSDPHLVLHDGVMYCYYRKTILIDGKLEGNKTLLYRKKSVDGQYWSERELVVDLQDENDVVIWGEQIISPSVRWDENKCFFECWYVDGSGYAMDRGVRYSTSKDGLKWEKAVRCELPMDNDLPWHLDVQSYNGVYYMLCYSDNNALMLYTSVDGVNFQYQNTILHSMPNTFFSERIYRSCSVWDGQKYRIYFPGYDGKLSRIGLIETDDWSHYRMISVWWNFDYHIDIIKLRLSKWTKSNKRAIKTFVRSFIKK